jgi:hypothetical protein
MEQGSHSMIAHAATGTKRCSQCKRDLPLAAFGRNRTARDGVDIEEVREAARRAYGEGDYDKGVRLDALVRYLVAYQCEPWLERQSEDRLEAAA